MTPSKPPEKNKTFQNMLTSWGGPNCESMVDANAQYQKTQARNQQILSMAPFSQQEKEIMIRAMEISSDTILLAGRLGGLNEGLAQIAKMAGNGIEKSIDADIALQAIYLFVAELVAFNGVALTISQDANKNAYAIGDTIFAGKK